MAEECGRQNRGQGIWEVSMTLTGIHFLLTYTCTYECDHCFLYCSPRAQGTFTVDQIHDVLQQGHDLGSVRSIYFEGGEPFLFHPVLVEGLRLAKTMGFETGIVTNGYWARSVQDAKLWLQPILEAGCDDLSVSDDDFHNEGMTENPARIAAEAARQLGLSPSSICIEKPQVEPPLDNKGQPVIGGGVLLKGRAADTLTAGLPTRPVESYRTCPYEELVAPERVHVDAFGNVQVCQGISIGNLWKTRLPEMMANYRASAHPICGPLVRGGPHALAQEYDVALDGGYVDECHFCFTTRRALLDRFPEQLTPPQVYGVSTSA
jgi:hypothetical protein